MSADDIAWKVEEACQNAWPSPRQVLLGGWLLRASGGATRRTNSVNPLRGGPRDPSDILARTEEIYRALGQPSRFRVPSIAAAMDVPLERAGYTAEGETTTLLAELADHRPRDCAWIELSDRPDEAWIALRSAPDDSIFRRMVDSIVVPKTFASCRIDGQVVAKAYGVLHDGLLVVESVVTHPEHRQRGYGARTVGHLMDWALTRGAGGACLQVVADNQPAMALYASLGFRTELYRYHYRSKDAAVG
jgi:ribosomal protein S18 acetylase RimI-like enzyme